MGKNYTWLIGVFFAALIAGILGGLPVAALSLSTSLLIILPLTLGVVAMFAGLAATWVGNMLAPEGERRDLVRVVRATEVAAAVIAVLLLALVLWLESMETLNPTVFPPLLLTALLVLSVIATLSVARNKDSMPKPERDSLMALGLLGLTGLAIGWSQALAELLRLFGI